MLPQNDSSSLPKTPQFNEELLGDSGSTPTPRSTLNPNQFGPITYTKSEKTTEEIKKEESNNFPSILGLGAEETGRVFYLISTLQSLLITGEFKEHYMLLQEIMTALQKIMVQNLHLKTAVDSLTVELIKPKFKVNFRHY